MSGGGDPDPGAFELQERRRLRRIAWVIALLVIAPLSVLVIHELQVSNGKREARLSAPQRAELKTLLDQREAFSQRSISVWNAAATREALAALVPGAERCPQTLKPPSQFSAGAFVKYATHDEAFGKWTLCILRPAAAASACAREYQAAAVVTALRARMAGEELFSWDLEEAKAAPPEDDPPRTVVLVDEEVPGKIEAASVGHVSFVPGSLTGRAFVYSPEAGHFVCGGPVSVRNSKTVEIEFNHFGDDPAQGTLQAQEEGHAALERDLEVQLRFALPLALHALP